MRFAPLARVATVVAAVVVTLVGAPSDLASAGPSRDTSPWESVDADDARVPLLVVGDSLCVDAQNRGEMTAQLWAEGWEPTYRCRSGEPLAWGIDQVRAFDQVPLTVVVALGTNPGPRESEFASNLTTMRSELRDRGARHIIWVNFANRAEGYTTKNDVLDAFVHLHDDLQVDWSTRVSRHDEWFRSDGLHYTALGASEWAAAIVETTSLARCRSTEATFEAAVEAALRLGAASVWLVAHAEQVSTSDGDP